MNNIETIDVLREKQRSGAQITDAERNTLAAFFQQMEAQEAVYLVPAIEKLRERQAEQDKIIAHLEGLRREKQRRLDAIRQLVAEY